MRCPHCQSMATTERLDCSERIRGAGDAPNEPLLKQLFHVTVWANRGRLSGAKSSEFESQPSEVSVQLFGWGPGSTPVVNPNTDDWSRTPRVNLLRSFTNWAANAEWAAQTFEFTIPQEIAYSALALTGKNYIKATYVAFDLD